MTNSIESLIIAYYDNRLSEAERTDLLRSIGESYEGRRLFQQHGLLRTLAQRSQSGVVVDADTERSLLAAVALSSRRIVPQYFTRRLAYMGALGVSTIALIGFLVLTGTQRNALRLNSPQSFSGKVSGNNASNLPALNHSQDTHRSHALRTAAYAPNASSSIEETLRPEEAAPISQKPSLSIGSIAASTVLREPPELRLASPDRNTRSEYLPVAMPIHRHDGLLLELAGTTSPIGMEHAAELSGLRAGIGYSFTTNDILGVRFGVQRARLTPQSGLFAFKQGSPKPQEHLLNEISASLFLEHREVFFEGHILIAGTLSAGLMSRGNQVSAGLEITTPMTSRLSAGLGLELSHIHWSSAGIPISDPVISPNETLWQSSESRNFLSAALRYVVTYSL